MATHKPGWKLATVTLVHRRSGKIRKINARDYADARVMDWWLQRGWRLKSEQRGNAPEDVEKFAHDQNMVNWHWSEDPKEQAKRGDKQRAYEERAMKGNISKETADADAQAKSQETGRPEGQPEEVADTEAVLKLPWFKRRKRVEELTGTRPVSADHARQLLEARSA